MNDIDARTARTRHPVLRPLLFGFACLLAAFAAPAGVADALKPFTAPRSGSIRERTRS